MRAAACVGNAEAGSDAAGISHVRAHGGLVQQESSKVKRNRLSSSAPKTSSMCVCLHVCTHTHPLCVADMLRAKCSSSINQPLVDVQLEGEGEEVPLFARI